MGHRDKPLYPGSDRSVARRDAQPSTKIPSEPTHLHNFEYGDPRDDPAWDTLADKGLGRYDVDDRQSANLAAHLGDRSQSHHHVVPKRR